MIEGQAGLNWPRWKRLAQAAEEMGYAGLFRSDHFTTPSGPLMDALELWASFTYLATATTRIEFGALVSPIGWRHPVIAAWSASAIDDLSGGRFRLGLGAGWQEREHRNYGFDLLESLDERFARLDEALNVVTHLFNSDEPFDLPGDYFPIHEGLLLPRPARPGGPPIVVGGNGPKRTLPLVAKYADEWNGVLTTPEIYKERSASLDELLAANGRKPESLKRTLMHRVVIGNTEKEAIEKVARSPFGATDVETLRARASIVGDPGQVAAGFHAFAEAGAERIQMQWLDLDEIDGLELLATKGLPQL